MICGVSIKSRNISRHSVDLTLYFIPVTIHIIIIITLTTITPAHFIQTILKNSYIIKQTLPPLKIATVTNGTANKADPSI
jgi:hypothetical protein